MYRAQSADGGRGWAAVRGIPCFNLLKIKKKCLKANKIITLRVLIQYIKRKHATHSSEKLLTFINWKISHLWEVDCGMSHSGLLSETLDVWRKSSLFHVWNRNWLGKSSNGLGPGSFEEAVLVISAKDCDFQFQSLCLFVLWCTWDILCSLSVILLD